jgi:hypothetical protein
MTRDLKYDDPDRAFEVPGLSIAAQLEQQRPAAALKYSSRSPSGDRTTLAIQAKTYCLGLQGLQGLAAAQGFCGAHGLHGPAAGTSFFAAQGLHGFAAAQGLHGLAPAFAAHGLHGLQAALATPESRPATEAGSAVPSANAPTPTARDR